MSSPRPFDLLAEPLLDITPAKRNWRNLSSSLGIDLVDAGDIRLLMPIQDNLYRISVPSDRKNRELDAHLSHLGKEGRPRPIFNPDSLARATEARTALYHLVDHFARHLPDSAFLDIGSFVGDVALRYALYCEEAHYPMPFYCIDPGEAGEFVPYNAELNGLGHRVFHLPVAVGKSDGFVIFKNMTGALDSSQISPSESAFHKALTPLQRLRRRVRSALSSWSRGVLAPGRFHGTQVIAPCLRLSRIVRHLGIGPAILKIDTENMESAILEDMESYLAAQPHALIVEMHAGSPVTPHLEKLLKTHHLYDIGYAPRPFLARPVITPSDFEAASQRRHHYTDILAISRTVPRIEELDQALRSLRPEPEDYLLTF